MPKYYIMLVDQDRDEMLVPVKAFLNPYDGQAAFASGMPQFFGGTDEDDDPPAAVLKKEITQESRQTPKLESDAAQHFFTRGNMYFYWAAGDGWSDTGTPWGSAREENEAEMDRIQIIDLTQFDADWDNNGLIEELVN